jgi:AcrR family transcriptional regulator
MRPLNSNVPRAIMRAPTLTPLSHADTVLIDKSINQRGDPMPRTPQQNQARRDERREQILRAALRVFAAKGLAATRISDIAAASDLSYGLVYHYFHDKEEIYLALVERTLRGALDLVTSAAEGEGPAWERLRALYSVMLERARATPEYFQMILQGQVSERPPSAIHTLVSRYSAQILERLAALIRQGQAEGAVVATDAGELAYTLLSLLQGLSFGQALDATPPGLFPQAETVMRLLRSDVPLVSKPSAASAN